MKYETVVEEMIEGKKAKLPEWTDYFYMNDKGRIQHKCGKINIHARDYLRDDWIIVEEKKSLSDKTFKIKDEDVFIGTMFRFSDVKEFIKDINKDLNNIPRQLSDKVIMIPLGKATNAIEKRAGSRLVN